MAARSSSPSHRVLLLRLLLSSLLLLRTLEVSAEAASFSFSFPRFEKTPAFDAAFDLFGGAQLSVPAIRMMPTAASRSGGIIYKNAIGFGRKPSFSTELSFSIAPRKGNGLAFFIAPRSVPKESLASHLFGVSDGVFAVEFDTLLNPDSYDPNGNHVGIDVGSTVSLRAFNASALNLVFSSGERLRSWVDFDGETRILEVRLIGAGDSRPADPFISYPVDLTGVIWQEAMFVGLCSSSSNTTQVVTIYDWSFRVKHASPYLMHSEPLDPSSLTRPPKQPTVVQSRRVYLPNAVMVLALGAACGAAVAFLVVFAWSVKVNRHQVAPVEYPSLSVEFGYEKVSVVGDKGLDGAGAKQVV